MQPVVFEKRLVYFHKRHNVIQEGRQDDISLIIKDKVCREQEGINFSMLLKVRCYVQMTITLFMKILNFVIIGVKLYKKL